MSNSRIRRFCSGLGSTVLVSCLGLLFIYPLLWMLFSGFKTNREIFRPLQLFPAEWKIQFFQELLNGTWIDFWTVFANSILISTAQAIGALFLTVPAGYVFAQHNFRFKKTAFVLLLMVIVVPRQALIVPLFSWLETLKLFDHPVGVILPGMVSGLGLLFFTQVFRQVPQSYIDTARLAGASEFQVILTLIPMLGSSVLSYALIHFTLAWHEHLIPMLVLDSTENQTLPIALSALYGASLRVPYAVLMAGSLFALLPTTLLFGLLYRRFRNSISQILVH